MTSLREAAQAALEALEYQCPIYAKATIESLRAALAEPNRAQKLTEAGYTRRPTLREMAEPTTEDSSAFEPVQEPVFNPAPGYCKHCKQYTIEEPLPAEPVQEPVAWLVTTEMQDGTRRTYPLTGRFEDVKDACDFGEPVPLYTAPPQRKPLTEEEIHTLRLSIPRTTPFLDALVLYTRAVEAAHGI